MAIFEPPEKPKPKPLVFGKPEPVKPKWQKALPWAFIGAAVLAIVLMIVLNPRQKTLVCSTPNRMPGFARVGTCTEE